MMRKIRNKFRECVLISASKRVGDAIALAGGVTEQADISQVNYAEAAPKKFHPEKANICLKMPRL